LKAVKRLNQRQHDCNNLPTTNNRKTSIRRNKMSDQENRNPQASDPQKPGQKPGNQPNQPVQQKPPVPIAQPKSPQAEPEKHDQEDKKRQA
jgi:hypothetical protein